MINSRSLTDYSSSVSSASGDSELNQRLGLYQLFLKLYEHHRGLLNEILDLENVDNRSRSRSSLYMQGVVQRGQVFLVTNLKEKTQSLAQPQNVWMIGRDRKASLSIQDKRLSRRHAAIQYVADQGFYLVDLDSTNGSFVNGEPVRSCLLLKDGDHIRLGRLAFNFFLCHAPEPVDALPPDLLHQINLMRSSSTLAEADTQSLNALPEEIDRDPPFASLEDTSMFPRPGSLETLTASESFGLNTSKLSEILDRFLKRQAQKSCN